MSVRYKRWFCAVVLAVGIILLALNISMIGFGAEAGAGLWAGLALVSMGVANFLRPVFRFRNGRLDVFNSFGMKVRSYEPDVLDVERDHSDGRKALYVRRRNGARRRLFASDSFHLDNAACVSVIAGVESTQVF